MSKTDDGETNEEAGNVKQHHPFDLVSLKTHVLLKRQATKLNKFNEYVL